MLTRNENEETYNLVLKAFIAAGQESYDFAYVAGYLGSLSEQMFSVLPKSKQRMFIASLVRAAAKEEARVIEKRNNKQMLERA